MPQTTSFPVQEQVSELINIYGEEEVIDAVYFTLQSVACFEDDQDCLNKLKERLFDLKEMSDNWMEQNGRSF